MKLYDYFKTNVLASKVGTFELIKAGVKSGGNSNVLFFRQKDGEKEFAVKFLTEQSMSDKKLKRFIDEYFALIQLPPHKNIVKQYHLDSFEYQEAGKEAISISYIIMKKYSSSLKDRVHPNYDGFKILEQIGQGLKHLHSFGVIHRDVKPENIFFDDDINEYVIGDFGIAHFDEEFVARLADTSIAERLANFSFSPEESTVKGYEAKPSFDIYSLGQIIHWWYTSQSSKGNRTPFTNSSSDRRLLALDEIVHKCIFNEPHKRFQSIDELEETYKIILSDYRDIYQRNYDLDEVIRKTFPTIRSIETTDSDNKIERFVNNLNKDLKLNEFWWVDLKSGDLDFTGLKKIDDKRYLFSEYYEIEIEKIIVYKHDSYLYNNFFIILTKPSEMFHIININGEEKQREKLEYMDEAILYNGNYYDSSLFENGYFEKADGDVIKLEDDSYERRCRVLKPYGFLVCPLNSGPSLGGNDLAAKLLNKVRQAGELTKEDMFTYLKEIRKFHSPEFTMRD